VKAFACVLVLIAANAACSSTHHVTAHPTPTRSAAIIEEATQKPGAVTAGQVQAHLGRRVPASWSPVDFGDARLWVPPSWRVVFGACTGLASGWIVLDEPYDDSCRQRAATIQLGELSAGSVPSRPALTVNGYRLYSTAPDTYAVPDLHVTVIAHGLASRRVLATLAASARTVALTYHASVPRSWHEIHYAGLVLAVPADWTVDNISGKPVCPNSRLDARVLVGNGLPAGCPPDPTYVPPKSGSATISDKYARPPRTTTDVDPTSWNSPWGTLHLQLDVRIDQSHDVGVTLGLGRDGRVGAAIIASVRPIKA
jgi:hypothetical protein